MVHMPLVLGVYLVFTKFLLGFYLVFTWCLCFLLGLYLVCTASRAFCRPNNFLGPSTRIRIWLALGLYVVCNCFLLCFYLVFTWCFLRLLGLHSIHDLLWHPQLSVTFHHGSHVACTLFGLGLYLVFTWCLFGVYLVFTWR